METNEHTIDILECLANLSNDEVFTPPHIANRMLDLLPAELWQNPNAKFLDPFTKSGVFLREIARRLIAGLESQIPDLQERLDHIFGHQLYGIAITELTALMSRRTIYCTKHANHPKYAQATIFENEAGNVFYEELSHTFERGKCIYCGINDKELNDDNREGKNKYAYPFIHDKNPYQNMQFDVIIGNPPYQMNVGVEKKNFAIAIYHKFVQQAIKLNPNYLVMITPSRWFAGGRGLDEFREEMLKDNRLKEIHDYPNASDVFPGVEIKGGVNYFLWQRDYQGDCLIKTYEGDNLISEMKRPLREEGADTFIRDNNAITIFHKVRDFKERSFKEFISVQTPFGLLSSFNKYKKEPFENSVKVYGNKYEGYIKKDLISKNEHWIDEYKIYVPKAIGSGEMKEDKIKPFLGEKNSCCTQTYLVIGPFKDKVKCENVISYINTKFFHFMLGLKKNTQDAMRGVYEFVPTQDFSKPWTDAELYAKYGLTQEEIAYIESMVREME